MKFVITLDNLNPAEMMLHAVKVREMTLRNSDAADFTWLAPDGVISPENCLLSILLDIMPNAADVEVEPLPDA